MIEDDTIVNPGVVPAAGEVVAVQNVSKRFSHAGEDIRALDDVSFTVPRGQFVAITGPSGSGKTTLLYMLGALDAPTSGTIMVDGIEVTALSGHGQNAFRRNRVGFVFQAFNLIPNLTMLENVMLPMELAGVAGNVRHDRAHELLEMVGLDRSRHGDRITKLSAGQQQRVAIARSLANHPAVILADEPTGNLDSKNGNRIVQILRDLVDHHETTVILVTHDLNIARQADRRLEMQDGRIVRG